MISNLERPALEEWLNSAELHPSQAADGSALICLNSPLARVGNSKPANCGIPRLQNTEKEKI